ncbi:hypothetical protein IF655_05725 [Streptomyces sp. DSM 110735]|uniref:hypothetical protein n=1 Tax=Streptomyces sp. DSM 110735 TaxID=2775031 RepID=UPI0018F298DF|nr:hypothetical protein [Streptomyces sp. DSM 110735]MBJ7902794.1 hypothetical protein [Streptomyces sp. DSM 110735]
MANFEEALDRLAEAETVYTLYLTGIQAHAVVRALEQAPPTDEVRVVRNRLRKQLDTQAGAGTSRVVGDPQRTHINDVLPDAEALLAFQPRAGRGPRRNGGNAGEPG